MGQETQWTCDCDGKAQRGSGKEGYTGKFMEGLSCELADGYTCSDRHALCPAGGDSVTAGAHHPSHPGCTRHLRLGFENPSTCGKHKMCGGDPLSLAAIRSSGIPPDHIPGALSGPLPSCARDRLSLIKVALPKEANATIFLLYLHENQQMLAS